MKSYLLDTNAIIYALAGEKPWASLVKRWLKRNQLVLSSIVVAEFLSGATKKETIIFEKLLSRIGSLPVDTTVARLAADYRKRFLQRKRKMLLPDCLIAATCKAYQTTLVTFDRRDFPMKDISVYKIT